MKFFCISEDANNEETLFLRRACEKKNIEFILIDPGRNSLYFEKYPKPSGGDCLYRVTPNNKNAKNIEYLFFNKSISTFYDSEDVLYRPSSGMKLEKAGISVPKTIPFITNNRNILREYSESLGGFPIIMKALGGKEGVGVMRIDSLESLFSVADYLYKGGGTFLFREYIDVRETFRVVVLGKRAIGGLKYKASNGDFRSNRRTGLENTEVYYCNDEIGELAISATNQMGLEFGGVDVIVDKKGKAYVLEINFPCQFGEVQRIAKIDIADQMLGYLERKSAVLLQKAS